MAGKAAAKRDAAELETMDLKDSLAEPGIELITEEAFGCSFGDDAAGGDSTLLRRWRIWNPGKPFVAFILCHPSPERALLIDPTFRKLATYAKSWGLGGVHVVYLFGARAREARDLKPLGTAAVGSGCDAVILDSCTRAGVVVAAWGGWGALLKRGEHVTRLLQEEGIPIRTLGLTNSGWPWEPLHQPAEQQPEAWK